MSRILFRDAKLLDPTAAELVGGVSVLVEGDWGHLPSKMAADLSEASRAEAAPEYRAAIESYYKAIATKGRR